MNCKCKPPRYRPPSKKCGLCGGVVNWNHIYPEIKMVEKIEMVLRYLNRTHENKNRTNNPNHR